jgi:hypothetical protein
MADDPSVVANQLDGTTPVDASLLICCFLCLKDETWR